MRTSRGSPGVRVPRVVVLTTGSPYGVHVVRALRARGVAAIVVLQSDAELACCFRRTTRLGRALEAPLAVARSVRRTWRAAGRAAGMRSLAERVVITGTLNSPRMRDELAALAPDLLVLGGVGLIHRDVIATARIGVLNGHPGLLPWVRGNGVVGHAIARGIAVGASCHLVDEGIDRGDVLERRLLPVEGPATLASLERDAVDLAAELLADVVASIVRDGAPVRGVPQRERHPLCKWLSREERARVDAAVRAGAAREAFARWRSRCEPEVPPWRLAADASLPPPERAGSA